MLHPCSCWRSPLRPTDDAAHANGELDALQAEDSGPNTWFGNSFGTQAGF